MKAQSTEEARTAYVNFLRTKYFSGLDSLRAISVIAVIWTHVTLTHAVPLLNQGHRGVDLFFAISGFLVTTLLLREYRREGRISLSRFYMRRTLRVFPLYYAVLAIYIVLVFATQRGGSKDAEFWQNVPAFATYTTNWFLNSNEGPKHAVTFYFAWSLATEEQFYLLWPPVMVLVFKLIGRQSALLAASLILLALQITAFALAGGDFLLNAVASMSPAILFGVGFAVLLNSERTYSLLFELIGARWVAPLVLFLLLLSLQLEMPADLPRLLMAVLVASVCIREDTWLHPLLKFKPLAFAGVISYGVYLLHMLSANVVRKMLGHATGLDIFVCTTALALLAAYVSYRFFETPLLALKKGFQPEKGVRPTIAGSVSAGT